MTALAGHLKLDKSVVSRRVKVAVARGYLRNLEQRDRQPARLIVGVAMPADVSVLPSAEQVRTYAPEPVATVATVVEVRETTPPSPPPDANGNGYHPELHPWKPLYEELVAGGMDPKEALVKASNESR